MLPFAEDIEYEVALHDLEIEGLDLKKWLRDYFELYKTVLIYPKGLPPIQRCFLKEYPLKWEFYQTYYEILNTFDYELDNYSQIIKSLE